MPKKPRSPRKRYKRKLNETHLKNLYELRTFLMNLMQFYAGESDSANELAAYCEALVQAVDELINAINTYLYPKM